MSFPQKLVLWLHLAFVAATIGPVTLAVLSTPRYIRQRDARIVRYLNRITFIFTLGSLGVLIAGFALASMISMAGKPWVIISVTLFVVALLLLVLIIRDQRKAIKALDEAGTTSVALVPAGVGPAADEVAPPPDQSADTEVDASLHREATGSQDTSITVTVTHLATVERGRIAMTGGLVSLIWLVILILMVWH